MRIDCIQNNYLQNKNCNQKVLKNPKFGIWRNVVLQPGQAHTIGQKPKHMNNTSFFRLYKIWEPTVKYLEEILICTHTHRQCMRVHTHPPEMQLQGLRLHPVILVTTLK